MTPDMIRQLPAGHALVIRGSYAPVIARLGAAWKDRAYKAARRAGTAIAQHRARRPSRPPAGTAAPAGWPQRLAAGRARPGRRSGGRARPATTLRPTRGADA